MDIIIVTNYTEYDRPDDVLQEVKEALEDGGSGYSVKRVNKRSVRVETSRADMDIVPVVELPYGGYKIPDRETDSWLFTNPPVHTDWSSQQNSRFKGRFKARVKMLKWWRRINPTPSRRPKGFVLEVLVSMHGPIAETHYGEAFAQTLENIRDTYAYDASLGHQAYDLRSGGSAERHPCQGHCPSVGDFHREGSCLRRHRAESTGHR